MSLSLSPAAVLPHLADLRLDAIQVTSPVITIVLTARHGSAACPLCRGRSTKVHSRYRRTIADQPWGDAASPCTSMSAASSVR